MNVGILIKKNITALQTNVMRLQQWWNVTNDIYSKTVLKYNYKALFFYEATLLEFF